MSTKNIILVIVLIIVIVFVVRYLKQKNNQTVTEIKNPIQGLISSSGLSNVISSGSSPLNTNTTTPPVVKTSGFNFGDKIYAKEPNVNTYKTASATTGNLASYAPYSKDAFIGTYLGKESVFTKILISNPASSVFALSNQIYSK